MQKIKSFLFFKRSFPYIFKYKKFLIIDLLFVIASTFCEINMPKLLRATADIITISLKKNISIPMQDILKNAFIFIILAILEVIGIFYMNYIGHLMGAKIETDMRRDIFSHIQKLNVDYLTNTKIGQLLSRFTHDLSKITEFMHHLPEQMVIVSLKFILSTVIILKTNIYIGFVILCFSPIMFFTCRHYNIKLREAFKDTAIQLGELNASVETSLLGFHIIKSFSNEKFEEQKFEEENKKTYKAKKNLYINLGKFNGIMRIFVLSAYFLVAAVGLLQLVYKNISATSYIMCFMYADIFLRQIISLLHTIEKYQEGYAPLIRFFEILDIKPTVIDYVKEDDEETKLNVLDEKIEFKNVCFRYEKGSKNVIDGLNVTIKKGEKIALIGFSGAGKTTFCSLLQRFYDVTDGEILIGDVNIKNISLKRLHQMIGVVEQNVYLFSGTIFQNIQYGNLNSSKEEVINAAKEAGIYEFIDSLPNKFETHVGERGIKLSGGQKQRVSIARMFLKKPSILILDEATSSLDINTERIIKDSLKKLSKNKTTITITHRLFTIKNSDRILVLQDGKIKKEGSHEYLINNDEFYKALFKEMI